MWDEIRHCFDVLAKDISCLTILLSWNGRVFTAGIDLTDSITFDEKEDMARNAYDFMKRVRLQPLNGFLNQCWI